MSSIPASDHRFVPTEWSCRNFEGGTEGKAKERGLVRAAEYYENITSKGVMQSGRERKTCPTDRLRARRLRYLSEEWTALAPLGRWGNPVVFCERSLQGVRLNYVHAWPPNTGSLDRRPRGPLTPDFPNSRPPNPFPTRRTLHRT